MAAQKVNRTTVAPSHNISPSHCAAYLRLLHRLHPAAASTHTTELLLLPLLQISNNCGMLHYTSGGQFKVPVVIRGPGGVGRQLGAEHSQRLESYFQSIPGVQLVAVSTVANAKALLKSVSICAGCNTSCVLLGCLAVVWGVSAAAAGCGGVSWRA